MLAVEGLSLRFGGLIATDDVGFAVAEGECHAIIGPNGAGKSTLIAQLAGERKPDSGRVVLSGEDVTGLGPARRARRGLGRSFQITSVFNDLTALENVALAVQARAGKAMHFWRAAARQNELVGPATEILRRVGLGRRMEAPVSTMAHGEKRVLEVAIVLAARPSLLLLDEPLAGMGPEEGVRMVELLKTLKRSVTILLIEHDMDAVFTLADRVSVLVYGKLIATGSPKEVRANAEVRRAYLGEDH